MPSSDVLPFKEALKHTPWVAGHGETLVAWDRVAGGLRGSLQMCTADGKACRHRLSALLEGFRREEMESLRAFGTTEDYSEREQLLTDITSLLDAQQQEKADKTGRVKQEVDRRESAQVVLDDG